MTPTRVSGTAIVVAASLAAMDLTVLDTSPQTPLPHVAILPDLVATAPTVAPTPRKRALDSESAAVRKVTALPLRFESNVGQTDERALFIARGLHSTLFLTSSEAVLSVPTDGDGRQSAVRMSFTGASASTAVVGEQDLPCRTHYLKGAESEWKRDIASYARVRYQEMYPGVDVVFYGREREVEYDIIVAPGADPAQVAMDVKGARSLSIGAGGDLALKLDGGELRLKRPVAYQETGGARRFIESPFVLAGNRVGFAVSEYDDAEPLTIDPVVAYSSYLGGSSHDEAQDVAVDADGYAYVFGFTHSFQFPTANALARNADPSFPPTSDFFITKLTPTGSALVFSTYLGGTRGETAGVGAIALDTDGQVYLTGTSSSPDFPTTENAYDRVCSDGAISFTGNCQQDAVIAKLSADGSSLLYSTFLGGSGAELGVDIAVDAAGVAYVLGHIVPGISGSGFPVLTAPFAAGGGDFLLKVDTAASGAASLVYSMRLGASFNAVAIDADGHAYLVGSHNLSYPIRNGYQPAPGPGPLGNTADTLLVKIDTGTAGPEALVYSTFLGGGRSGTSERGVAIDGNGLAYVTGDTDSVDFPVRNAYQTAFGGGNSDAFDNLTGSATFAEQVGRQPPLYRVRRGRAAPSMV